MCVRWYSREHSGTSIESSPPSGICHLAWQGHWRLQVICSSRSIFFIRLVFSESNMGQEVRAGMYATSVRCTEWRTRDEMRRQLRVHRCSVRSRNLIFGCRFETGFDGRQGQRKAIIYGRKRQVGKAMGSSDGIGRFRGSRGRAARPHAAIAPLRLRGRGDADALELSSCSGHKSGIGTLD